MAINVKIKDKNMSISGIYYKFKNGASVTIKSIYNGTKLVWTAIKEAFSVFGAGFWQNDKPWINDDFWKNE